MPELVVDDVLIHYGVKGMRWGKRKDSGGVNSANSSSSKRKKSEPSEDHQVAVELRKKQVHEMSNIELKRLNERLQLETQYAQLTQKQTQTGQTSKARKTMVKGQKILKNTLAVADTANKVITTINSPAAQEVKKLLKT